MIVTPTRKGKDPKRSQEYMNSVKARENAIVQHIRARRSHLAQHPDPSLSALANAQFIHDFRSITYPEGITPPRLHTRSRPLR